MKRTPTLAALVLTLTLPVVARAQPDGPLLPPAEPAPTAPSPPAPSATPPSTTRAEEPAPVTPAAPAAAPAPEEKKAEPFAYGDFTWMQGNNRQKESLLDGK